MSQAPTATPKSLTIPGKVFVCGEYAVLASGPALVAACGPRFGMELRPLGSVATEELVLRSPDHAEVRVSGIPEDSPAARWLEVWTERARLVEGIDLSFVDPYAGAGGFGASTAQFALAAIALGGRRDWRQLWREYRALHEGEAVPPSGADLAAQLLGGMVEFSIQGAAPEARPAALALRRGAIAVFSATADGKRGRKVRTHEHLRGLGRKGLEALPLARLTQLAEQAVSAAASGTEALGEALTAYARALAEAGLEAEAAAEDREALARVEGVFGAKGAGARLADGMIVVCREDALDGVVRAAAARGLVLVERRLDPAAEGWRAE